MFDCIKKLFANKQQTIENVELSGECTIFQVGGNLILDSEYSKLLNRNKSGDHLDNNTIINSIIEYNKWFTETKRASKATFCKLNKIFPELLTRLKIPSEKDTIGTYAPHSIQNTNDMFLDVVADESFAVTKVIEESKAHQKNLMIIGEGGQGKTATLLWLLEKFEEEGIGQIPFFFALNDLNETYCSEKFHKGDTTKKFISAVFDEFMERQKVDEKSLIHYLETETDRPLLLLLDGLNEVRFEINETVASLIGKFAEEFSNVTVVITSRKDLKGSFTGFVRYIELPLQIEKVVDYLGKHKKGDNIVDDLVKRFKDGSESEYRNIFLKRSSSEQTFLYVLRNPMMLTIFCQTKQTESLPKNKGDVIKNYFETLLDKEVNNPTNKPLEKSVARFIFGFCLPCIAAEMGNSFEIGIDPLLNAIEKSIKVFINNNYKIMSDFVEGSRFTFYFNKDNMLDEMRRIAILTSVDTHNESVYKFSHQHFRDFLSAEYYRIVALRSLNLGKHDKEEGARHLLSSQFSTYEISNDVLKFMGEILEDYKHKPEYDKEQKSWKKGVSKKSCIEKCLDLFRGNLSDETKFTVHNLIKICLLSRRGDLSGMDLSRLNLSEVYFNNAKYFDDYSSFEIRCSQTTLNNKCEPLFADFSGSIILDKNLLPRGHGSSVDTMLKINEHSFYTFSSDRIIYHNLKLKKFEPHKYIIYDSLDSESRKKLDTGSIFAAKFIDNRHKRYFVTFDDKGNFALWEKKDDINIKFLKCVNIGFCPVSSGAIYTDDYIIICKDNEKKGVRKFFHYYNLTEIFGKTFEGESRIDVDVEDSINHLNTLILDKCNIKNPISELSFDDLSQKEFAQTNGLRIAIEKSKTGFYFSMGLDIFHYNIRTRNLIDNHKLFAQESFIKTEYYGEVCTGKDCNIANSNDREVCAHEYSSSDINTNFRPLQIKNFMYHERSSKFVISVLGEVRNALFICEVCNNQENNSCTLVSDKCVNPRYNYNQFNHFSLLKYNDEPAYSFLVTVNNGCFYEYNLDGEMQKSFVGYQNMPSNVREADYFNVDGKLFCVSISNDRSVKVWDRDNAWLIEDYVGYYDGVRTIKRLSDKGLLLTAEYDHRISVWQQSRDDDMKCLSSISAHNDWVWGADILYDNNTKTLTAISGSKDSKVKEWDLHTGKEIKLDINERHTKRVNTVSYSKDGKYILSAGEDEKAILHEILDFDPDTGTKKCFSKVIGENINARAAYFSKDGNYIFLSGSKKHENCPMIQKCNFDGELIEEYIIPEKRGWLGSLDFDSSGRFILTSSLGVRLTESGATYTSAILIDSLSDDNQNVCAGLALKKNNVDLPLAGLFSKSNSSAIVRSMLSPHGEYVLMTGGDDRTVHIFKKDKPNSITCVEHDDKVFGIEFENPEVNNNFYTTTLSGYIYLWDFAKIIKDNTIAPNTKVRNISGFLFHKCDFSNVNSLSVDMKKRLKDYDCRGVVL